MVENYSGEMVNKPDKYRIVLLKFRKQHKCGRKWSMPMFLYELYAQGGCRNLPPNDIAENNSWWSFQKNPTPWFATTGDALADVVSLGERTVGQSQSLCWKNTRNKKMRIGVAIYKNTGDGKIGWHRCSNIAYIELYKHDTSGRFHVNMMP